MSNHLYRWNRKMVLSLVLLTISSLVQAQNPNILLIIADDLGVDYSNGYHNGALMPTTPTLDSLRAKGLTFDNVFAAPKCTPTRAAIMSGKFGIKSGVVGTPGNLDTTHQSIFRAIEAQTGGMYADAVIGKWHISLPTNPLHPLEHGADYYTGLIEGTVSDYYAWERTENGTTAIDSSYITSALTDDAINWVNSQTQPWFLWLAHVAPHAPFHEPPDSLYSISATGTNKRKYVAMIEALDHEIGRLLNSLPANVRDSTIVIFAGDNGTPNTVLQDYPAGQGKSTVYQGGIRVPLIVTGPGVTRIGEREPAMVHLTDIYATLLELTGANLPGGIYNSLSFRHLLNGTSGSTRDYNYSEVEEGGNNDYTVREARYKLIEFDTSSTQGFFDLMLDSLETNNLMLIGLDSLQLAIKADLEAEAMMIRTAWSCRDHIQNGDETGIDCGGTFCTPCSTTSADPNQSGNLLKVYPNPAGDELYIQVEAGTYHMEVIDAQGKLITSLSGLESTTRLDINAWPSGIYFLRIEDMNNHQMISKSVIKQ